MADFSHMLVQLQVLEARVNAMAPNLAEYTSAAGPRNKSRWLRHHQRPQPSPAPVPSHQPPPQPQPQLLPWMTQWCRYGPTVQRAELNTTMAPGDGLTVMCRTKYVH
jgi:hypothetical protein